MHPLPRLPVPPLPPSLPRTRVAPRRRRCAGMLSLVGLQVAAFAAGGANRIRVELAPRRISVGEIATLEIEVRGNLAQPVTLPQVPELQIHPSGRSTQTQIIGGRTTSSAVYQFQLSADIPGVYTLPAFTLEVDGHAESVPALALEVERLASEVPAPEQGKPPYVLIQRRFSNIRPYVGEPLVVTTELLVRVEVLGQNRVIGSAASLSRTTIGEETSRTQLGGVPYQMTTLYERIDPLEPGSVALAGDVVKLRLLTEAPVRSLWDLAQGGRSVVRAVQSEEATLLVRERPQAPAGQTFSGIVGEFELSSELSATAVRVGESITLTLSLQGYGSLDSVQQLPLPELAGFRTYEETPSQERRSSIRLVEGRLLAERQFRYAMVATAPGESAASEISVLVFNPKTESYQNLVVTLPPLQVQLNPDLAVSHQDHGAAPPTQNREVNPAPAATQLLAETVPDRDRSWRATGGFPAPNKLGLGLLALCLSLLALALSQIPACALRTVGRVLQRSRRWQTWTLGWRIRRSPLSRDGLAASYHCVRSQLASLDPEAEAVLVRIEKLLYDSGSEAPSLETLRDARQSLLSLLRRFSRRSKP